MDEDVAAVRALDEAETLLRVEPLHRALLRYGLRLAEQILEHAADRETTVRTHGRTSETDEKVVELGTISG
jgi:hypothetical protein